MEVRKPTPRETFYLVVLGAVLVGWMFMGDSSPFGSTTVKQEEAKPIGDAPVVHIERLALAVPTYDTQGRNLFKYGPPPAQPRPPAPPPPTPTPTPPRPRVEQQPRDTPPPPPPGPRTPRPPEPSFKYLGHLGPKADQIAVFEAGENMVLARAGDTVENQFKVVAFKYETVVLGYTDERFKDQTTELTIRR